MTFVDLALEAIREVADEDSHIGNYLDRDLVDSSTIIRFASTHPGYPHWRWCVACGAGGRSARAHVGL